jgi:hypothetical protein
LSTPSDKGPREFGPQFHSKGVDGKQQVRRTFSEIEKKKGVLKDVDAADRDVRFKAILAAGPGAFLGGALGYYLVIEQGYGTWVIPVCMLVFGLSMTGMTLAIVNRSVVAAQTIYAPTGKMGPRKKEYSYAESLVMRGEYEDAISAFEMVIMEEDASDPTPYLRIARIYRDHLDRAEDSARWLKRALGESKMRGGLSALARKELVELYRTKLGLPHKAAPMLARMAEENAGTPEGDWAAEELRFVKEQMREEEGL